MPTFYLGILPTRTSTGVTKDRYLVMIWKCFVTWKSGPRFGGDLSCRPYLHARSLM